MVTCQTKRQTMMFQLSWGGVQIILIPIFLFKNRDAATRFPLQPFWARFSVFLCCFTLTCIFLPWHSLLSTVFPFTAPGLSSSFFFFLSSSFTCGFLPFSFKLSQLCTEIEQKPFVQGILSLPGSSESSRCPSKALVWTLDLHQQLLILSSHSFLKSSKMDLHENQVCWGLTLLS